MSKHKLKLDKDCCGCTACASICPNKAISMTPDAMGFEYAEVDDDLCSHCDACTTVCQFHNGYSTHTNFSQPYCYAARIRDLDILKGSQSGALFIALSDYVLQQEGVVYGAIFTDSFMVVHGRATTKDGRDKMRGSKYVQSNLQGIFELVKQDLQNNKEVLFSGTPCQVAGLKAFIGDELKSRLLLVDIVCHGVTGPYVWRDYLNYLEKKKKDKIIWVSFRDKEQYGWEQSRATFVYSKHPHKKTSVYGAFYRDVLLRESCSNCPYGNMNRPGDITIGDYWGDKSVADFCTDDKGCSVVLVNTMRGHDFFELVKSSIVWVEISSAAASQYNLRSVTPEDCHRNAFAQCYSQKGFLSAMKKYSDLGIKKQVRMRIGTLKRIIIKKL